MPLPSGLESHIIMPFYKAIEIQSNSTLYLWKITEDFDALFREVRLKDVSLSRLKGMKSESHQKGFMAVRLLLQHLGYSDFDLYYDELGKPHLQDGTHLSISHSHGFSGVLISDQNVGLDIEQLKPKTLNIAGRYMEISHLENLSEADKLEKATIIWGIKECVFKIKNEVGISFIDHIFENDFMLADKKCTVELRFNNKIEHLAVFFDVIENYVFVCAFAK